MSNPINPNDILQRILNGTSTDTDIEYLRHWFESGGIEHFQAGKYNVNIEQGQDIYIGDRTYHGFDAEAIREIIISAIKDAEVKIARKSGRENITNSGKMAKEKVITAAKGTKRSRRPKKSNLEISIEISRNVRVFYNPRRTEQQTKKALQVLGSIGYGSGQAVRGILFLIGKEQSKITIAKAIKALSKIGKGNSSVMPAMLKLLISNQDSLIIIDAMRDIIKMVNNNDAFVQNMLDILSTSNTKIRTSIIVSMGEIANGTRIAIDELLSELKSSKNSLTLRKEVAKSLGKIAIGDTKAIQEMDKLSKSEKNKHLKACLQTNLKRINC